MILSKQAFSQSSKNIWEISVKEYVFSKHLANRSAGLYRLNSLLFIVISFSFSNIAYGI